MVDQILLLDISDLPQTEDKALPLLDPQRLQKALSKKTERARAASVGAGLLLRYAVSQYERSQSAAAKYESEQFASAQFASEQFASATCEVVFQEFTVKTLLEELENLLIGTGATEGFPDAPGTADARTDLYRYGEKGKPYFREIPLYFSLSHSGAYVLLALSKDEIGADLQKKDKNAVRTARRFFSEAERAMLARCEEEERDACFFSLWTQKEAYAKLTGEGLSASLSFDLSQENAIEWIDIKAPAGYAAVACKRKKDE